MHGAQRMCVSRLTKAPLVSEHREATRSSAPSAQPQVKIPMVERAVDEQAVCARSIRQLRAKETR
eukprot:5968306-Prymnesium_polylepis.1